MNNNAFLYIYMPSERDIWIELIFIVCCVQKTLSIYVYDFFDKRIFRASRRVLPPWVQTCPEEWERFPYTKNI